MTCNEYNTEVTYESPRMTIVPVRCSGAMLTGSAPMPTTRKIGTMDLDNGNFYYEGQDGGTNNTATVWTNEGNSGDWGTGFF